MFAEVNRWIVVTARKDVDADAQLVLRQANKHTPLIVLNFSEQ